MVSHPALVFRELARKQEQAGEQQERLNREREGYQRQIQRIEREASKIWEAYTGEAIDLARFKSLNAELEVKKLKITAALTTLDATVQALAHSALDL
jgi:chromosome segregation ATPase